MLRSVTGPGFLPAVAQVAEYLRTSLEERASQLGCPSVRGRGMLLALVLPKAVGPRVCEACFDAGLLLNSPRPELLRFMPALTVTPNEVDAMLANLRPAVELALRA